MPRERATEIPPDDRLSALGREWFAEVRRKNPDEKPARKDRGGGDADGGLLDWLFGDGEAGDSDGGGDGGD